MSATTVSTDGSGAIASGAVAIGTGAASVVASGLTADVAGHAALGAALGSTPSTLTLAATPDGRMGNVKSLIQVIGLEGFPTTNSPYNGSNIVIDADYWPDA